MIPLKLPVDRGVNRLAMANIGNNKIMEPFMVRNQEVLQLKSKQRPRNESYSQRQRRRPVLEVEPTTGFSIGCVDFRSLCSKIATK